MKLKVMQRILISVAILSLIASNSFAGSGLEINVNYATGTATVSGNVGEKYQDRYVTLNILNPGKEVSDIFSDGNALNWSDFTTVKADGTYRFEMNLTPVESVDRLYRAVVSVDTVNTPFEGTFELYSKSYVKDFLNKIAQAVKNNDTEELRSLIEENDALLGIKAEDFYIYYLALNDTEKAKIYSGIIKSDLSEIDKIKSAAESSVNIYRLVHTEDETEFEKKFFELAVNLHSSAKKRYDKYSEEQKKSVINLLMSKKTYLFIGEMERDFENEIVKRAFSEDELVFWTDMLKALQEFDDIFELDWTDYNKLNSKNKPLSAMLGINYSGSDEVVRRFNSEVASALEDEKNEQDHSNKKGGSGGGGSSPSGKTVEIKTEAGGGIDNTESSSAFSDTDEYKWAQSAINRLSEKGIISGYEDGTFRPQNNVTRAEFTKMLIVAFNLKNADAAFNFKDVSPDNWYYQYVAAAANAGLINGDLNGSFNPASYITREDIAVVFYRQLKDAIGSKHNLNITDADDCSDYAKEGISGLNGAGIIRGYEDGSFRPKHSATRAEVAVIVDRVMSYLESH